MNDVYRMFEREAPHYHRAQALEETHQNFIVTHCDFFWATRTDLCPRSAFVDGKRHRFVIVSQQIKMRMVRVKEYFCFP